MSNGHPASVVVENQAVANAHDGPYALAPGNDPSAVWPQLPLPWTFRAFLEFGLPGPLKTEQLAELCRQVTAESQLLVIDLIELVFTWMKRFPALSDTASAEQQFKALAATVRQASVAPPGLQGLAWQPRARDGSRS
jgi:hypothetical protein